jgi:hypothetical protein
MFTCEPVIVPVREPVIVPVRDPVIVPIRDPVAAVLEPVIVPALETVIIAKVNVPATRSLLSEVIFILLVNKLLPRYCVNWDSYSLKNFLYPANCLNEPSALQPLCQ